AVPVPVPVPVPPAAAPTGSGSGRFAALRQPLGQPLGRRALITGIAAGAAGLVIGGGGVLALADDEPSAGTDSKPGNTTPKGLAGLPPEALWAYEQKPAADEILNAAVIGGRTLLLTTGSGATGVDARTGKRLWRNDQAAALHQALPASGGLAFVAGATGLLWISTASGAVEHRVDYADGITDVPGLTVAGVAGTGDGQVWFTGSHTSGTGKAATVRTFLFAFDLTTRKELWRSAISNGRAPLTPVYQLIAVREADIVVRQDAKSLLPAQVRAGKGKAVYHCFGRADGKLTWSKSFGAVPPTGGSVGDAKGRLFAAAADQLYAYDTADAKQLWRRAGAPRVPGQNSFAFGTGTLLGSTLYVANRFQEVYAVDPDSGMERWKGTTEGPAWNGVPRISLSESGRTVLSADGLQVTAFGAADGKRLWKFQNAGEPAPSPAADGVAVATPAYQPLMAGKTAVIRRGGTFYALPVD
ncbi:PQQ-binding-like beta-propeller repeat protein, partial [Streptomyces sp. PSRA5]|uniref:outer membrane protein assembly factor BamB family protein n=1 Tax=Streptomyces panacea TaxID=3035064 RepID=UPI00339CC218